MAEIQVPFFSKYYKYTDKMEEEGFVKRYLITGEHKSFQQVQKKKKEVIAQGPLVKLEKVNDDVVQTVPEIKREAKEWRKQEKKQKPKKIDIERKELEEFSRFAKINLKRYNVIEEEGRNEENVGVQKKKSNRNKYRKNEKEEKEQSNQEKIINQQFQEKEKKVRHKKEKKEKANKEPTFKYDDYLTLQEIESSRLKSEKKYYKGRVQYGQGPKWRGKIYSDQVEGILIIEGKHRNRTIHDDRVYFSIIHEQSEKQLCTVHHIFQRSKSIVGKVQFLYSKNCYILNPINSRINSMNVKAQQYPKNMKKGCTTHYYLAEMLEWGKDEDYPICKIVEQFGKFGDIDVETSSLLKIHGIEDKQHDPEMVAEDLKKFLDQLDERGEFKISQQELNKREDLRSMKIFTIDPLNARDFDDAISVDTDGDNYRIGVHIADASFFLEEGSHVDQQARKRTTSVYLVHRVIPMLPRILCENLCSLNPGCERLTFTIWIKLNKQGKIIEEPTISRSVIHSKARFTYEQAQQIINGEIKTQNQMAVGFGCVTASQFPQIAKDIKLLHEIASQLRKRRIQRGSLFFEIPKKVFKLNEEHHPMDFEIYQRKQANFLVEQLMILANEQIGQILVRQIGQHSLLRRHKYPGPKKIDRFQQFMKKIGVPVQMSQQTRVQDQVNDVLRKQGLKQSIRDIIKYEMIYLLEQADYFTIGQSTPQTWIHYALNSPVYTHFTSPIRRYPDILVHRQLASILQGKKNIKKIPVDLTQLCNEKKLQSKRVSNGCEKIFMCLYLRKNIVVAKGIIGDVEEWGIRITVPKFDFKGTMRFKEVSHLKVTSAEQDAVSRKILKMQYDGEVKLKFILKQYQQIDVQLSCKQGFPLDYKLALMMPNPKLPGQHIFIG